MEEYYNLVCGNLGNLVILGGLGQLGLVLVSLMVPGLLGWGQELSKVNSLTRKVFWVYAGYILCTNISLGLLCLLGSELLIVPYSLSAIVNLYIALYWGARLMIQFFCFGKDILPFRSRWPTLLGEIMLVTLLVYMTLLHGSLAIYQGTAVFLK